MAKVLQHRRGTAAEHANFTGAAGEVTVDTTDKRLVVHDGSTKGGVPAAKKSEIVDAKSELQQAIDNAVAEIGGTIDAIEGSIAELRKHNVGEEWVSYTGVVPQGGVPYLGQEVTREMYADLWAYAQANGLVVSESEWQSLSSSQNGNVGKYSSGDGSTTFRMPKVIGYVKGASSLGEAGSYTKEGLPDHTHHIGIYDAGGSANGGGYIPATSRNAGSVIVNSGTNGESGNGNWTDRGPNAGYDTERTQLNRASAENAIYGNSSHVTPETSVVLFGVYAFGEVTNAGSVDVQNVANTIARVEAGYLPLTGGEVNGVIINAYGDLIKQKTTNGWSSIKGGTENSTGGYFTVFGKDFNNGMAIIGACNGKAVTEVAVNYNGTATINGSRIVTANNPLIPNYGAGVAISSGYTAPSAGIVIVISEGSYSGYTRINVNGREVAIHKATAQLDSTAFAWVNKGDSITYQNGGTGARAHFYPLVIGG